MEDGAPSSCRPPWLETMMASAPVLAARMASSLSRMPFRISLPPQRCLIHSTSAQDRRGSNCSWVHDISEERSPTPLAWPALGAQHAQAPAWPDRHVDYVGQRHLGRRRQTVAQILVALGEDLQVERQNQRRTFRRLGAVDQIEHEILVAHDIELEPERLLRHRGDILDRADAHGRQRERHAEFFRRLRRQHLAVGMLHAGRARRRQRHRHRHSLTDHGRGERAVVHVDQHTLAQFDLAEILLVGSVGALRPRA